MKQVLLLNYPAHFWAHETEEGKLLKIKYNQVFVTAKFIH